jgi:hypothetical protein
MIFQSVVDRLSSFPCLDLLICKVDVRISVSEDYYQDQAKQGGIGPAPSPVSSLRETSIAASMGSYACGQLFLQSTVCQAPMLLSHAIS